YGITKSASRTRYAPGRSSVAIHVAEPDWLREGGTRQVGLTSTGFRIKATLNHGHCPFTATIEPPLVGVAFGDVATIAQAWRMLTQHAMTGRKNFQPGVTSAADVDRTGRG